MARNNTIHDENIAMVEVEVEVEITSHLPALAGINLCTNNRAVR
jgi:hypothetical protein